jgi:hypothetical protein
MSNRRGLGVGRGEGAHLAHKRREREIIRLLEKQRREKIELLPALLSFRVRAASIEGNPMRKTVESRKKTQSKRAALIAKPRIICIFSFLVVLIHII